MSLSNISSMRLCKMKALSKEEGCKIRRRVPMGDLKMPILGGSRGWKVLCTVYCEAADPTRLGLYIY
jgi:hypothetical protein